MEEELAVVLILALIILAIYIYVNKYSDGNIFENNIYLDNNGTTMMCKEALKAYVKGSTLGNASASYATEAKKVIENTDNAIRSWIGNPNSTVIYTSGGSESNCTILKSISSSYPKSHFIISSYEHSSLLECAKSLEREGYIHLTLVAPNIKGFIEPIDVVRAINDNTSLISIMHVNNELGTINDIANICKIAKTRKPDVIFHTDAVQSFGKISIPTQNCSVDAISVSFHKLYGPQGVGALIINNSLLPHIQNHPLIYGSQNYGARGGTMNISGINASLIALKKVTENRVSKNAKLLQMKSYIIEKLYQEYNVGQYSNYAGKLDNFAVANSNTNKKFEIVLLGDFQFLNEKIMAPNTLLISVVKYGPIEGHFCNIKLKKDLQDRGVIVSIGSACHSASPEPSHVLTAIKAPYIIRCGVLRISLGDYNTMSDVKQFCNKLIKCINLQA